MFSFVTLPNSSPSLPPSLKTSSQWWDAQNSWVVLGCMSGAGGGALWRLGPVLGPWRSMGAMPGRYQRVLASTAASSAKVFVWGCKGTLSLFLHSELYLYCVLVLCVC